jgi:hypothetical protein
MERGLIWLPLLVLFVWLAWSGWNEYQKVESYRIWSQQFDRAKYDIYAVLGKKDTEITWGIPTRKGLLNLETFSLKNVREIRLLVNDRPVDLNELPTKGSSVLEFSLKEKDTSIKIPFTEIDLAAKWRNYLQQEL